MLSGIKTYIYGGIVILIIVLGLYCKVLNTKLTNMTIDKAKIDQAYSQRMIDLNTCSDSTKGLKAKEVEITNNALALVDEAKKKAVLDYKNANKVLFTKPSVPVITSKNIKYYGSTDVNVSNKDYLATQQLVNDFIDSKVAK